jgi:NAD(P)-dependent dehydrogenase (short-subunit alcohol dehydrogenase family)
MSVTRSDFGSKTEAISVTEAYASQVADKIILITGVNAGGIGGATAIALSQQEPRLLILAGRNRNKVNEVIKSIESTSPAVPCHFLNLDLSSQDSCRHAAEEILSNSSIPHIDILINNAGVMTIPERTLSPEGIEMQFATNHIGHYLFTNLIVSKLISASQSSPKGSTRIVNVSSIGTRYSPIRFSDINLTKYLPGDLPDNEKPNVEEIKKIGHSLSSSDPYTPIVAYGQSKTANILYTIALNRRLLDKHGILSLALHPGAIMTELMRHTTGGEGLSQERIQQLKDMGFEFKTLSQGASTQCVAALDPALVDVGSHAKRIYLTDCQITDEVPAWSVDEKVAERLWEVSEELVGQKFDW